jgi:hypothetical protein
MAATRAPAAEEVYRSLACPNERNRDLRERFLSIAEPIYAQTVARQFVDAHAADLDARGGGLRAAIEGWSRTRTEFRVVWASPLTDLYQAVRDEGKDPVRAAAGLALQLGSSGLSASWAATLLTPSRLRWERFLLPQADSIAANSTDTEVAIEVRLGDSRPTSVRFRRTGDSRAAAGAIDELAGVGTRNPTWLLPRPAIPPGCMLGDLERRAVPSITAGEQGAFESALSLIERHAPDYASWVQTVIRDIVVLRVSGDRMRSGSHAAWPGLVYMSTAEPVVLAENLVHEASHQYFHLLTRVDAPDDGSDTALYFSPVVGRERPLSAILVAFHAFANVWLFLASTSRAGDEAVRRYSEHRRRWLRPRLRSLADPLRGNAALTETGRAVFEALLAHLDVDEARL